MSVRWRPLLFALLVVLAGCSTSYADHPIWTGDPDNPWREAELTVAVDGSADPDRDYEPLVREALDYWEQNADRYAGYPIRFQVVRNAEDPDMTVRFVDAIDACGSEEHTAGCAPVLTSPMQVDRPVDVRVRTEFSDASTVQVLKHEFGHTLGLTHDDEPQSVMAAKSQLTTPPQRDATDRAMPWPNSSLSVYVDEENLSPGDREETFRQVRTALGYYDGGAEGTVPENLSLALTDDPSAADVTISFTESSTCTSGAGSCGSVSGSDPDGDGALETYTHLQIVLVDVDVDATAWHVGYWLGYGMGFEDESEYPPPFVEASYEDRRSEWWR